jgi:hypothetical protein
MNRWTIFIAMLASGALLGWIVGIPHTPDLPPNSTPTSPPPHESLLANRDTGWLDQWEDERSTGRPFIIPGASASDRWDEDRKQLATLAYQDPETAIAWIRKHLPEAEHSQRIRKEVIQPLMAVDFRKGPGKK